MVKKIEWMADFIKTNKAAFVKAGATKMAIWIYWTGIQGNMEFTAREIKKLGKLNIPVCMHYAYVETDE